MRNNFTALCLGISCMLFALTTNAQDEKTEPAQSAGFHKGSQTLGIAIGLGLSYNYIANTKSLPAVAVVYDRGIKDTKKGTIGLGAIIGYKGASFDYANAAGDKARWTNMILAARGTYHFHIKNNKLDPYVGLVLGIRYTSYSDTYLDKFPAIVAVKYDGIFPVYGGFVGARYSLSSKAGIFGELGYDISILRLGFSLGL